MAAKQKSIHRKFESGTERGKFTKIADDMLSSPAWDNLNLRQRGLYLEIKKKFTQKVSHGVVISDNANNISFPKSEAADIYSNLDTFRKDMGALMENGFIVLVQSGKNTRTCNIYGFSDGWKAVCANQSNTARL